MSRERGWLWTSGENGENAISNDLTSGMSDAAADRYRTQRKAHWDHVAQSMDVWTGLGAYYQKQLSYRYQLLVAPGMRVLELGCGRGDLLAALKPALGVGVDFSAEMIKRAAKRHPSLQFVHADVHKFPLAEKFDVIILSDLVNDLWDVQGALENLAPMIHARTQIILNTYSRLWEVPLVLTQRMGLSKPSLDQNWLTVDDIANLLRLVGFDVIQHTREILCPLNIPVVSGLANRLMV